LKTYMVQNSAQVESHRARHDENEYFARTLARIVVTVNERG